MYGAPGTVSALRDGMTQRSTILKAVTVATVLLIAAVVLPHAAEAQARGTLQATARVVDTRTTAAGLEAARGVLQAIIAPGRPEQPAAPTVALVSVTQRPDARAALVVTIDYSRN